jgi:predicted GTPase
MSKNKKNTRIIIMGAAGRDFHNFNMVYRNNSDYEVIAFTATQIPDIAGRRYPASLAGPYYPDGIPIHDESELDTLCRKENIDQVVFAYSDVSHALVMHKASVVLAAGSDFLMLGPERTMLKAKVPVISVCAVRTGCGKSQTTRWLSKLLKQHGIKVAVIPHMLLGNVVYAGVDYAEIVARAESEVDVILWDGGNNDFSFIRPDLHIVMVDPLRPGHETTHHPGEAVLRTADIILISKVNSASDADIQQVSDNARQINPTATLARGASPVHLDDPEAVRGKRVLVVEDGPTITHGGMPYGAGYVAATEAQAAEIIDPRSYAVEEIAEVYANYPHIGAVLPAVGYHSSQLQALRETINATDVDVVVAATPCDIGALIEIDKPVIRAHYEFAEVGEPGLASLVEEFLKNNKL